MLADGIVIATTWYKLYRGRIKGVLGSNTLSNVLLVDGEHRYYVLLVRECLRSIYPTEAGSIYFMYVNGCTGFLNELA